MIDRIVDFPQSLWAIAFVFYAFDCARLIAPGTLLLSEAKGGRFKPTLARTPFEVKGRELYFPSLLMPWRGVFITRWAGAPEGDVTSLDFCDALRARLSMTRVASTANFVLLFVMAPLITLQLGLGAAVLGIAPTVYLLNVAVGLGILRKREEFAISRNKAVWLMLDSLLCAPYGCNWTKRVARCTGEIGNVACVWDRLEERDREQVDAAIAARKQEEQAAED